DVGDGAGEEDGDDDDEDGAGGAAKTTEREGDEDDDDLEALDPDDVEAALDTILKDRIAAADEDDEDEDEEAADAEDRVDGSNRIVPKRPGEFVCQSCFLVKHPSQLADPKHQLCFDCV